MGRTRVPNVCQHPQHQPSPLLHLPVHHIFSFCLLSLEGIWVEGVWRGVVLFAPPVLWWDEKWCGHPFFPLLWSGLLLGHSHAQRPSPRATGHLPWNYPGSGFCHRSSLLPGPMRSGDSHPHSCPSQRKLIRGLLGWQLCHRKLSWYCCLFSSSAR